MKQFLILTLFLIAYQFSNGQACGMYRIEYVGRIITAEKQIVNVSLPTTMLLDGVENEESERAFIDTPLNDGSFKIEIGSQLTIPYSNIDQLISSFRRHSDMFKMKVSFSELGIQKEKIMEIDWEEIEVTVIEDGKIGTLFRFLFKDLIL